MKKPLGALGVVALILGLLVADLFVLGRRERGSEVVGAPRAQLVEPARSERAAATSELAAADPRVWFEAVDVEVEDGPAAPVWGGLAGVVVGAGGHGPLPGASVRITALADVGTTTDERGAFRLPELDPARRDVHVAAPGWAPALVEDVRIRPGELTRLEVTLQPAQTAIVEVHAGAGDDLDAPVPGAVVRLCPGGESAWVFLGGNELANSGIRAQTDADGRARFDQVRPGAYYALVCAADHPVWRGDVVFADPGDVVRVDLETGGTIAGRVLDAAGRPGAGHVLIGPVERVSHPSFYYGSDDVQLDERGEFLLPGVPEGEHHLVALLDGGEVALTERAIAVERGETVAVELVAARTGTIRGRVTDEVGRPLAGARVKVVANAYLHPVARNVPGFRGALFEALGRSASTDADGRYVLADVRAAAGRVKVSAELEGHATARAAPSIRPGQDLTLGFVLAACDSVVAGRFVAPFAGDLGGISVVAKLESADQGAPAFTGWTRADGSFELAVPSSGSFMVMAAPRDLSPPCRVEPRKIDGVPSGSRDVEFTLEPQSFLRVRAVDERGAAVGSLEISLFDDVAQRFAHSRVENSSDGLYEAAVDPERHLFATLCSVGYEPVEIWDLARKLDEVQVVELRRSGAHVRVRVVDADGEPVAGAGVALAWFGERGAYPPHSASVPSVLTDELGEGLLRAVPASAPRDFLVVPGREDAPPLVHLEAPDLGGSGEVLVLRIPESPKVEIELTGPGGEPAQGGCLILSADGLPIATRAFASLRGTAVQEVVDPTRPVDGALVLHLEPGEYTLHHLGRHALAGDVRIFDFTVREEGPNTFAFQVDG